MTDNDKALVERLRVGAVYSDDGRGNTQAIVTPFMEEAADRIEAQAAEIEALKTMIFATGEAAATNLRTAMERAAEIERLREALRNTERVLSCAIGNMEAHKECDECQQSVGTYHEAVVYARAALENKK